MSIIRIGAPLVGPSFATEKEVRKDLARLRAREDQLPTGGLLTVGERLQRIVQRNLRDQLLNGEIIYTLREAKVPLERWRWHYNHVRPHSSLGHKPPAPEATASNALADDAILT